MQSSADYQESSDIHGLMLTIEDPTTIHDLMKFILMTGITVLILIMIFMLSNHGFVKFITMVLIMFTLFAFSFIESNRERMIENRNVNAVESYYGINKLETDDIMGVDPGAGTIRSINVSWFDKNGIQHNGKLTLDATGSENIASITLNNGTPLDKKEE